MNTTEYKGYTIRIEVDDDPINPRKEYDNLTRMMCFHRRYDLGDGECGYDSRAYSGWDEMLASIIKKEKPVVIKPLYLMDHSGISISTKDFGCPWDSGQIGFVWIPRDKALAENNWKTLTRSRKQTLEKILLAEVETYNDYVMGNVYGFVIEKNGEHMDSCWGFIGDSEYPLVEAKAVVDGYGK